MISRLTLALVFYLSGAVVFAQVNADILPPAPAWSGKSRALAKPADHPMATPFEKSGLKATPNYPETVAWLKKLCDQSPLFTMQTIGTSAQGRDIVMIIASTDGSFTAEAANKSNKPIFFAHAGIHAGEIDGKDAGMMLLRDFAEGTRRELLDKVTFLFIPILSVDGHERFDAHNRINQRGPQKMGWRTNGRNLNLNRDFSKLETSEIQAVVRILNQWKPDLYYDLHVTDGIDYQYDITFGHNSPTGHSPHVATWLRDILTPALDRKLEAEGHVPGRLIFAIDNADLSKGIVEYNMSPRLSTGYADIRHLPTLLLENHSLKPYDQRVLGTYWFLAETFKVLAEHGDDLRKAVAADQQRRPNTVTLTFKAGEKPEVIEFKGITHEKVTSELSGGSYLKWTGKPLAMKIPYPSYTIPDVTVTRPEAYWIPADWADVIAKLEAHGVQLERITKPVTVDVDMVRIQNHKFGEAPFEGRFMVSGDTVTERRKETFAPGSARVPTDQPLGELIVHLLEPAAPDSFFQWGWFNTIFQRTEYFEVYALEPLAQKMVAENPQLKKEFDAWLAEHAQASQGERLDWFYRRSPYVDARYLLYPVARTPLD